MTSPSEIEFRSGISFDSHPLADGRKLVLGGVEVPHDRGLSGHSDGDVLVHAVMDALLGAANLGDKGLHFPSSDPQYRDISSLILLERVGVLVAQSGGGSQMLMLQYWRKIPGSVPSMPRCGKTWPKHYQ